MGRCIENIKEWLHILAQYTFHYTCPVCHTTVLYEKGICPGCLAMLETEEGARTCPTCRRTARECTCTLSLPIGITCGNPARSWLAHTFYNCYEDGVLSKLLHNAKKEYKAALFDHMATSLAADLHALRRTERKEWQSDAEDPWQGWWITWIPRSLKGYNQYGFDQGEECACRIADILGIPAVPLFVREAGRTQKTLNAVERRENAGNSLHLRRDLVLPEGPLLLYDDVITTGSSMAAALFLLAESGITAVFPIAYARTVRGKRPEYITKDTEK